MPNLSFAFGNLLESVFQVFSLCGWFNAQMWNPQTSKASSVLLIGTPEQNLTEFTLLLHVYSRHDSQIEVVFYMSTQIPCFRPSKVSRSQHCEVESLHITHAFPILSNGEDGDSCLIRLLGFTQKDKFATQKALTLWSSTEMLIRLNNYLAFKLISERCCCRSTVSTVSGQLGHSYIKAGYIGLARLMVMFHSFLGT